MDKGTVYGPSGVRGQGGLGARREGTWLRAGCGSRVGVGRKLAWNKGGLYGPGMSGLDGKGNEPDRGRDGETGQIQNQERVRAAAVCCNTNLSIVVLAPFFIFLAHVVWRDVLGPRTPKIHFRDPKWTLSTYPL